MDNRDDTQNNQSSSFLSPPSDLLTFVNSNNSSRYNGLNQTQTNSSNNNSNSNSGMFIQHTQDVQSKPASLEDLPVIAISDFSNLNNNTFVSNDTVSTTNNSNIQGNSTVINNDSFSLINELQGNYSSNKSNQVNTSNSEQVAQSNEQQSPNKFLNFNSFGTTSYNNYSSNNSSFSSQNNNPYGIQSVVQNAVNSNNNLSQKENVNNSNYNADSYVFNGFGQITNNQQSQNNSFGPSNNLQQIDNTSQNVSSDLPPVSQEYNSSNAEINNPKEVAMDVQRLMQETLSPKIELERKTKKENKLFFTLSIASGAVFIIVLLFAIFGKVDIFNFSIQEVYYENKNVKSNSDYSTAIVTDNKWRVEFDSKKNERTQAIEYIKKDSQNQKEKCTNESVKKVEQEIEEKYGIVAVNFCELDYKFANEIKNMIAVVHKEFPMVSTELTNLTLQNMKDENGYDLDNILASFKSASLFAKSTTLTGYPQIYKMSILLNAKSFLDPSLGEKVRILSGSGHFSSGATRSSIVAHEFGHYLSFLAQLHNSDLKELLLITRRNFRAYSKLINASDEGVFSKKILDEAYNNATKKGYSYSDLFEFRSSISSYAASSDMEGMPLYDETIAEAFHDYYLNRDNANPASLEIMKVLKKYLNN